MNRVKLRKVPGGLVLGLLASLTAHAALYGGQHAVGGVYHTVLMQITLAAALGFVSLFGALAWTQSASSTDGSIVAARLREQLPGVLSVVASAAGWYAGVEAIEPHHVGVPAIALLAVLAVASYAVLRLAHAIAGAFARIAIAFSRTVFSPRVLSWRRRPHVRLIARHSFLARRRFARPPPVAFVFSRG